MLIAIQNSELQFPNRSPVEQEEVVDIGLVTRFEMIEATLRICGQSYRTGQAPVLVNPGQGWIGGLEQGGVHMPGHYPIALGATCRSAILALHCGDAIAMLNFSEEEAIEDARFMVWEAIKILKGATKGSDRRQGQAARPQAWLLCDLTCATSIRGAIEAELQSENITPTAIATGTSPFRHGLFLNSRCGGTVAIMFLHSNNFSVNNHAGSDDDGAGPDNKPFNIMSRRGNSVVPDDTPSASNMPVSDIQSTIVAASAPSAISPATADTAVFPIAADSGSRWSIEDFPLLPTELTGERPPSHSSKTSSTAAVGYAAAVAEVDHANKGRWSKEDFPVLPIERTGERLPGHSSKTSLTAAAEYAAAAAEVDHASNGKWSMEDFPVLPTEPTGERLPGHSSKTSPTAAAGYAAAAAKVDLANNAARAQVAREYVDSRQATKQSSQAAFVAKLDGRISPSCFQRGDTIDHATNVLDSPKGSRPYASSLDAAALNRLAGLLPEMLENSRRNNEHVTVVFSHLLNRLKRYSAPSDGYERLITAATELLESGLIHDLDGDDISVIINGMQGISTTPATNDLLKTLGKRIPSTQKHWTKKAIICMMQGIQHHAEGAEFILNSVAAQIDYLLVTRRLVLRGDDIGVMAYCLRNFTPKKSTISIMAHLAEQLHHLSDVMDPRHISMVLTIFHTHDHKVPAARDLYSALTAQVRRLAMDETERTKLVLRSLHAFRLFAKDSATANSSVVEGTAVEQFSHRTPDLIANFLDFPDIQCTDDALLIIANRMRDASREFSLADVERIMFGLRHMPSTPGTIAIARQLKKWMRDTELSEQTLTKAAVWLRHKTSPEEIKLKTRLFHLFKRPGLELRADRIPSVANGLADLLSKEEQGQEVLNMLTAQISRPDVRFTAHELSVLLQTVENHFEAMDAERFYTVLAAHVSGQTWRDPVRQLLCSGIHALKAKRKHSPAARSLLNKMVIKACADFALGNPEYAADANGKFMLDLYGAKLDSYSVNFHGAGPGLMEWLTRKCIRHIKDLPRQRFEIIVGKSSHSQFNEGKALALVKALAETAGLSIELDPSNEGICYLAHPAGARFS